MVKLSLPLRDYDDVDEYSKGPHCDPSQSIYSRKHCVQNFLFCSDDNPCPSDISCIDQVCQCLPNKHQYITLTPLPHRMYTVGCNFDRTREAETCREYEYGVDETCILNYCSKDVPCYAGTCDTKHHVCVNMTSTGRLSLPSSTRSSSWTIVPLVCRRMTVLPPVVHHCRCWWCCWSGHPWLLDSADDSVGPRLCRLGVSEPQVTLGGK